MPASKRSRGKTSAIIGRQEITRAIAANAGLTQKKASEVLEATLESIGDALKSGNEVRLVGFGSFKVRQSAARKGVNPRSGESLQVAAKNRVRFSPGKGLSDALIGEGGAPRGYSGGGSRGYPPLPEVEVIGGDGPPRGYPPPDED